MEADWTVAMAPGDPVITVPWSGPGDDIRTMDWRVTARTGKPFVRVYTEEKDHWDIQYNGRGS